MPNYHSPYGGAIIENLAIVGGGIGGLSLALTLRKSPLEWRIFDQSRGTSSVGSALAMAPNAMWALRRLGMADPIKERGSAIQTYEFRNHQGALLKRLDLSHLSREWQESAWCIPREHIMTVLTEALPRENILSEKVVGVRTFPRHFRVDSKTPTGSHRENNFQAIVGADGAHSLVRSLFWNSPPPDFQGFVAVRGIVAWDIEKPHTVTQMWGPGREFGYSPMGPGLVYWYATIRVNTPEESLPTPTTLWEQFRDWASPAPDLIAATPHRNLLIHPIYDQPYSWISSDRAVTLIGDAAHLMTPNTGQGACQAILDAYLLGRLLTTHKDHEEAFILYRSRRLHRALKVAVWSRRMGRLIHGPQGPLLSRPTVMRLVPTAVWINGMRKILGHPKELQDG